MENTEINIERPLVPYFSRLIAVDDILSLVIIAIYFIWILNINYFSPGHIPHDNALWIFIVVLIAVVCRNWYRNNWLPAQNFITGIYTSEKYIYIKSVSGNGTPQEAKYYFKDIKFETRPIRFRLFMIVFKVLPEDTLGKFKMKYGLKRGKGWKNGQTRELFQELQTWKNNLTQAE